jgi:hypothetical protein
MYSTNSLFGGLAKIILILVIVGSLVGLVLALSDPFNLVTNEAKAEAIRNQNYIQAQEGAIDIRNHEAVQKAVTQNQIDQLNADCLDHSD